MSWDITLYESKPGRKPVEEFIKKLQPVARAKLLRQLELLKKFGPTLDMPNAKPIGDGLYELRARGKQEVRVIYIFVKQNDIYLLHAFLKKSRAISRDDLTTAQRRQKEIKNL
jgi:phage-related protein